MLREVTYSFNQVEIASILESVYDTINKRMKWALIDEYKIRSEPELLDPMQLVVGSLLSVYRTLFASIEEFENMNIPVDKDFIDEVTFDDWTERAIQDFLIADSWSDLDHLQVSARKVLDE